MKKFSLRPVLQSAGSFLIFFLTVAFAVTCCMLLFLRVLSNTVQVDFTPANSADAAKITLVNVLVISGVFSIIDYVRRKLTVSRPVKAITEATGKIMRGDFTARVQPIHGAAVEGFDEIITAINTMAEELSGIETLRTDFVANVSHEMKTPLAVMQNYGTLLQAPDLSDEKRIAYAKGVTDASRRLADMMTNILKLNRLENQKIYPAVTAYDLGEQLCQCLLRYETLWETRGIEIETDIAEGVQVNADTELLSLVWNNLFSNAFKFTEAGGTVTVTMTADPQYATVRVKDTGCGMTPEVGAHIFEKFYQGDTSHSVQGNGLGLALVKRVIHIVEGEIQVESTPGVGTTFTVKIRRICRN